MASLAVPASALHAQELEPPAYSNAPIGMNFALVGYGYTEGNVLTDAAVPIEDARAALKTFLDTPMSLDYYIHAPFNFDGRVDRVLLRLLK